MKRTARREDDAFGRIAASLPPSEALSYAVKLVRQVCYLAADSTFSDGAASNRRVRQALKEHDTPWLYDWLMGAFSLQGISDAAAWGFIEANGNATWTTLAGSLATTPCCPKLKRFDHFEDCGFVKSRQICNEPHHLSTCPLPALPLRNGRLNQTAYSLFLFIRDVCDGDLAAWIEHQLKEFRDMNNDRTLLASREAILEPMRGIFGVADKVLNMTLATLLMAAPRRQKHWVIVGSSMIAVDSLVHNFLHRTGILKAFDAEHAYGSACYRETGCSAVIGQIASAVDARRFNPAFPRDFPRFIQHAIWRYCAQDGLDLCNGNQIDDDLSCQNIHCIIHSICRRAPLHYNVIIG